MPPTMRYFGSKVGRRAIGRIRSETERGPAVNPGNHGTGDAGMAALRQAADRAAACAPGVSAWSVGMHVHHCCLSTIEVCRALCASLPPAPTSSFSPVRELVFLTGRIPRGRAAAPDRVRPTPDIGTADLLPLLDESDRQLERARRAPPDAWFRHFAFGSMTRDRTLKFLRIHNGHHARIIADILAASNPSNHR